MVMFSITRKYGNVFPNLNVLDLLWDFMEMFSKQKIHLNTVGTPYPGA